VVNLRVKKDIEAIEASPVLIQYILKNVGLLELAKLDQEELLQLVSNPMRF
jgi:hypothetical protein